MKATVNITNENQLLQNRLIALTFFLLANLTILNALYATELKSKRLAIESESLLEIEDWMTNSSSWNTDLKVTEYVTDMELYPEESLLVEDWMKCDTRWEINKKIVVVSPALEFYPETSLEVEDWMKCDSRWGISEKFMVFEQKLDIYPEASLEVEDWMKCDTRWSISKDFPIALIDTQKNTEHILLDENWLTYNIK